MILSGRIRHEIGKREWGKQEKKREGKPEKKPGEILFSPLVTFLREELN
jgi:hypothetical protein